MGDYLLNELRTLASKNARQDFIYADDAARIVELVQELDECLTKGGFLPADWQR